MTTRRILTLVATGVIWLLIAGSQLVTQSATADNVSTPPAGADSYKCKATTRKNHENLRNPEKGVFRSDGTFGNDSVYTILGSKITFKPGGAGWVLVDGSLAMKYMWWRVSSGQLSITGHRLDKTALPLRASIPDGYGDIGFQATSIIFPTPGCWEVTGSVGDSSITFVVHVALIGDGPCSKEVRKPGETGGKVVTSSWSEEELPGSTVDQVTSRVTGERKYEGGKRGIRGNSSFQLQLVRQPDGLATFEGYEDIEASIGPKSGSFTVRHDGQIAEGIIRSAWKIVDESGSGELAGIVGYGEYSSGLDDDACYSFFYSGI